MAFNFGSDLYGISVSGPAQRTRQHPDAHAKAFLEAKQRILATWRESEAS